MSLLSFLGALSPNEDGTPNAVQRFDQALNPEVQMRDLQQKNALLEYTQKQQEIAKQRAIQDSLAKWQQGGQQGGQKGLLAMLATVDPTYGVALAKLTEPSYKTIQMGGNIVQIDENNPSAPPIIRYGQPTADERKQMQAEEDQKKREKAMVTAGHELLPVMNTALGQIDMPRTEGLTGAALSLIPGTKSADLSANLDTVKARIGLDELARLKAASPTGASGLGAQSQKEQEALQNSIASLNRSQSDEQLKNNLLKVKKHYVSYLESLGYAVPEDLKSGKTTVADEIKQKKVIKFEDLGK
jgi:hypothetical protein